MGRVGGMALQSIGIDGFFQRTFVGIPFVTASDFCCLPSPRRQFAPRHSCAASCNGFAQPAGKRGIALYLAEIYYEE